MKRLPILILPLLLIALSSHAQRYRGYDDYTKFRVGVQGGWSYRLNKISPSVPADFRSYVKGLKTGYNYGANAAFFFSESLGAGIEYSGFRTKNEMEVSVMDATTYKIYKGTMSDDISIGFIGPSFLLRGITGRNDNIHILGKFALGYVSYKDEFAVIGMNATNTAGTVGAELAVCLMLPYKRMYLLVRRLLTWGQHLKVLI